MEIQPLLELKNISKCFGGIKAIERCNFFITAGEVTAVIGTNGSGKSTLLNIISGLIPPKKGNIKFKGIDITNMKPYQRYNEGIARTFQKSRLFYDLTTEDNLSLGDALNDEALDILKNMGLINCNYACSKLSGGQRRIVEIVRAVTSKCELVLLDEPFSGLHQENKIKIAQLIKKKCKTKTFLITDHDMDTVFSISQVILLLKKGQIEKFEKIMISDKKKIMEIMYGA